MPKQAHEVLFEEGIRIPEIAPCDHYAGRERFIRKAFELQNQRGALFDITCDLEDGSSTGEEISNARIVAGILTSDLNKYRAAGVRIHPPSSAAWEAELDVLLESAGSVISHITVPKALDADEVFLVHQTLEETRRRFSIEREIPIHVLIETQSALQQVFDIATLPGIRCLDFGLMDFISGHAGVISFDCIRSPGQFEHALLKRAKTMIVAAASANGLVAAHNVTVAWGDPDQTRKDALRARIEFGFLRMWSIHPSQIDPILEAMSPAFEDLSRAVKLLSLAQTEDWAPVSFEGDLHDRASYRYYWQLLQRARRCGAALPEGAEALLRQ